MTQTRPVAALDIGSNTIRLLVACQDGDTLIPLQDSSEFVRLGKGVAADGKLAEDRIAAAITAIKSLLEQAAGLNARDVTVFATSAVRDSANRDEFVTRVHAETGAEMRVLSGDEEARLTFLGATLGRPLTSATLVCDLGGGSSELIFATPRGIQWATSLQLGSGRLTELFVHHDPPQADEVQKIETHVRRLLESLPASEVHHAVFTGGTATHIALLAGKQGPRVDISRNELLQVKKIVLTHASADVAETYRVRPERAEVLPSGCTAVLAIVDFFHTDGMTVTSGGIREGAISRMVIQESSPEL